jgi:hypothetical protein
LIIFYIFCIVPYLLRRSINPESKCEAVVTQKSTKTEPKSGGEKNMSEMNLSYTTGNTAQDLEGGQIREWSETD